MSAIIDDSVLQSKIRLVQGAVNCTEEEAQMALEGAGGDVHIAIKLLDLIAKDILVIKFRFEGKRAATVSGLGYVAADIRSGKLLATNTVVTYRMSLADEVTADLPWRVIESSIASLKDNADINLNATMDLDGQLNIAMKPWRIDELGRMAKAGQDSELKQALREELTQALREDLRVEVAWELLTRVQYDGEADLAREDRPAVPDIEPSEAEAGNGLTIFLQSELVVAPIDGVPVESLTAGQTALVRITDTSQIGSYLATLLGGRNGPETVPLAAPVTRVEELPSGRLRVEFRFGPGVMGKAICDRGVKVSLVRPESVQTPPSAGRADWLLIVAGLLVLLLALLLKLR